MSDSHKLPIRIDQELIKLLRKNKRLDALMAIIKRDEKLINTFWQHWGGTTRARKTSYCQVNATLADKELRESLWSDHACVEYLIYLWFDHLHLLWPDSDIFPTVDKFWQLPLATHLLGQWLGVDQNLYPDLLTIKRVLELSNSVDAESENDKIWEATFHLCQVQWYLKQGNDIVARHISELTPIFDRLREDSSENFATYLLLHDDLTGLFELIGKELRSTHERLAQASKLDKLQFLAVDGNDKTDEDVFRIVVNNTTVRFEALNHVFENLTSERKRVPSASEQLKALGPINDLRDKEIISTLIEACDALEPAQSVDDFVPTASILLRHVIEGTSPQGDEMDMLKHFSWAFITDLQNGRLSVITEKSIDHSDCTTVQPLEESALNGQLDIDRDSEPLSPLNADSALHESNLEKPVPVVENHENLIIEEELPDETSPEQQTFVSQPGQVEAEHDEGATVGDIHLSNTENNVPESEQILQDAINENLSFDDLPTLIKSLQPFDEAHDNSSRLLDTMENLLLDRKDTAAFYWLSKARNKSSNPLWLAEMIHLGVNFHHRFRGIQERFQFLLSEEASLKIQDCSEQQMVLITAAMIRPVLMNPDPLQVHILSALQLELGQSYGLALLLTELSKLAQRGYAAAGEQTLSQLISHNESQHWHKELSDETDKWLETARRRTLLFAPTTAVWRHLTGDKGELSTFLIATKAGGDQNILIALNEQAQRWKDKSFIRNTVHHIQEKLKNSGKVNHIDFKAMDAIFNHTEQALLLADEWLSYHQQNLYNTESPQQSYYHRILDNLATMAKDAISLLQKKNAPSHAEQLLMSQLSELAGKYENLSEASSGPSVKQKFNFPLGLDLNLWLIRMPGATLDGRGGNISLSTFLLGMEREYDETAGWLEHLRQRQYLLPAYWLTAHPDKETQTTPQEKRTCAQILEESVEKYVTQLKVDIVSLRDNVEGRYYCGAIAERNRDDLSRKLDELSQVLDTNAIDFRDIEAMRKVQDIGWHIGDLAGELNSLKEEQCREIRETIAEIKLPPEAEDFINELVEKGEIGAANDHLADFRDKLERNGSITLPPSKNDANFTKLYFSELGSLASADNPFKYILARSSEQDQGAAEAQEYWESWNQLTADKGFSSIKRNICIGKLTQLLRWLGFTFEQDEPFKVSHKEGRPHFWLKFELTDVSIKSGLPRWGSQSLGRHTLILGWSDYAMLPDEIIKAVEAHKGDGNSSIVLMCFSRLDENARKKLGQLSRARKVCPLVIDQNLMAWLCNPRLEPLDRSQAMFQIGLAGGSYNPYTPEVAGAVPREMFFGREKAIEQLWDMAGSCLVYGGRQLGKSALLQQVRDRYHRPEAGDYVLYSSAYSETSIHEVVINMLKKTGLPKKGGRLFPSGLKDCIQDWLNNHQVRRIVLLIDESDNLLDADRQAAFKEVDLYRDIMQTTNRRFKVVFAGLHSVQRYQRYPNNPLAHFGIPLCIGPLSPSDAYDLIVKPMEILGICFEDDSLVYRVLSLTNHHPSLIQLFCSALVQNIQDDRKQQHSLPPLTVNETFIDKVYRQADLRESIKKRFDWTLDLDKRYRVIGYTMALLEFLGDLEGFGEGIAASRMLPDLKEYWPDAFQHLDIDTVESLMTEMAGLGLLSPVKNGFRLRNSNVIKLLGGEENIYHELENFKTKKYEDQGGAEGLHRLLPAPNNQLASPLLFHQESTIKAWGIGVELVVGSRALGLDKVELSLRNSEPNTDLNPDIFCLDGNESVRRQAEVVKEYYKSSKSQKNGIIFIVDSENNPYFWQIVSDISRWMDRLSSPNRYLKLIGLVHPDAYLDLVLNNPLGSQPCPPIHHLARWNVKALDYYFANRNLAGDGIEPLLERTGGWYVLLMSQLNKEESGYLALPLSLVAPLNSPLYNQVLKSLLDDWQDESATLDTWEDILAESIPDGREVTPGLIRKLLSALVDLTLLFPIPSGQDQEIQYKLDRHYLKALQASAEEE